MGTGSSQLQQDLHRALAHHRGGAGRSAEVSHTIGSQIRQVEVERDEARVQQRQHGAHRQRLHAEEGHRPRVVLRLRPATKQAVNVGGTLLIQGE